MGITEAPIITPRDIVALPEGQAFALLEGQQFWKVRMPLPDPRRDPAMPESLAAITADTAHRYHTQNRTSSEVAT